MTTLDSAVKRMKAERGRGMPPPDDRIQPVFRPFRTSPEIIRLTVMLYVRLPLSLRNVEGLLHERGIEVSHETVQFWWCRFGPLFAAETGRKPLGRARFSRWHLDEVFLKMNGVQHYLWQPVHQ